MPLFDPPVPAFDPPVPAFDLPAPGFGLALRRDPFAGALDRARDTLREYQDRVGDALRAAARSQLDWMAESLREHQAAFAERFRSALDAGPAAFLAAFDRVGRESMEPQDRMWQQIREAGEAPLRRLAESLDRRREENAALIREGMARQDAAAPGGVKRAGELPLNGHDLRDGV